MMIQKRGMNKGGWIRIVEAFIAITLISAILLTSLVKDIPRQDRGEQIQIIQRALLEEIARDDGMRDAVLAMNKNPIEDYVGLRIPKYLNFSVEVCELNDVCAMQFYIKKDVYAAEKLISSNLTLYDPKKVKLFIWEK